MKNDRVKKSSPKKSTSARPDRNVVERWGWAVPLLAAIAVYGVTLTYGITYLDDYIFIFDKDAFNQHFSNLAHVFTTGVFMLKDIYYRPLFLATFVIERAFVDLENSLSAFRLYHVTNLALHLACVALLQRFLKMTGVSARGAMWLALLFAVHPVLTMAVAWIPGRNDTLLTLFVLLFFIQLHRYVITSRTKYLVGQALCWLLALLTKETAVFVPFAALLFLWSRREKLVDKKSLALYVTWLPLGAVWYLLRSGVLDRTQDTRGVAQIAVDAFHRLPAYLVYLGKCFFPFNLSVFPTLVYEPVWFGVAAVVIIGVLIWLTLRNQSTEINSTPQQQRTSNYGLRSLAFGIGWFVIFIAPFLLVPPNVNDQVYEHRLYLPMVGLLLMLGHTLLFNGSVSFRNLMVGCAAVAILFAMVTFRYLPLFNDPIRFWENAAASSPDVSYPHKLLGVRYENAGEKEKALVEFKRAYALNKSEKHVRYFIARDELEPQGKTDEALKLLTEETKLNPTYTEPYFEISHLYFQKNNLDSTLKYLLITRNFQPDDKMVNNNLLLTYIRLNNYSGAKAQLTYMQGHGLTVDAGTVNTVEALPH